MNREPHSSDDSWESDTVWKLLDEAPAARASGRFVADVMRDVRLDEVHEPWWKRLVSPLGLGLGGLAGAAVTAAVVLAIHVSGPTSPSGSGQRAIATTADESFGAVQELADTEVLEAAADHLDRYSDTELVSMIGL